MLNEITNSRSPGGARFYKCALQVNPHNYGSKFRGQDSDGDGSGYAQEIVKRAVELGIEVLAVTDHNSVSSIEDFRAAAHDRDVHIFPGFELASSEGVHLLCVYPPCTKLDRLERYLGEFGIHETSPSSNLSNKTFKEVLELVNRHKGVAIAAHVTGSRGFFDVLKGEPRIRAWKDNDLIAVQIPGTVDDLPHNVKQIVRNRDPAYHRSHSPEPDLAIATINARDIVNSQQLEEPAATCWIKMHEVSIDGLRQAFLDPGSRIRLNSKVGEFRPEEHMELVSLAWEGGFLDGIEIRLNPNLNILIGGRGTGKSTIVESIRSALGLTPIGEDARNAHDGIVRHVLRSGTKISLRVRVQRPAVCDYLIERTIPNPPIVRSADGAVLHLSPTDILPGIATFGQHEISELARSPDKLIRLLERFVERDESRSLRKTTLRNQLAANRRDLIDTRAKIATAEEQLDALPGLEETLERYQDAGLEDHLMEQSLLLREEQLFESVPQRLASFRESLDLLRKEIPIDLAFLSERALAELPGKENLSRLRQVLRSTGSEIQRIATELNRVLKKTHEDIDEIRSEWDVRRQEVQKDYEQILRNLQQSRVDGEEFIRLRRRIEEMRPIQDQLVLLQRVESERSDQRRTLLAEWEDIKAAEFRTLDQAARAVSKNLDNRVQVELAGAGNREPLFKILREEIGGRMSESIENLQSFADFSLTDFVEACQAGVERLCDTYRIPPAQAERLSACEPEVLMRMEELELAPTTSIRLNTAPVDGAPVWQPLQNLSSGQKATAVLLLLLLESSAPLIVDQPEDDLDNRFITEGVVPRMRDEKQRRQFIFSTHNANIPVLGDAELILGLSASGGKDGGRARVASEHMGSIDSRAIRVLVEEILEGGRKAFEIRRRKYGF